MKGKVGWWWNKIFMEIFRRHLTVVWIAKPFVLKSFVFSFFVPVWNSLLNLWLFFMSFVATSSYVIVSRPCCLLESYLNRPSILLYATRIEVNHNKHFGDTMVVLDRRVLQPNGENCVNTRNISGMLLCCKK